MSTPFHLKEVEYQITTSIGITLFSQEKLSVDELFKRADLAMYKAKEDGRNTIRFYEPKMQEVVDERARVTSGLRQALNNDELSLYYQPQVTADGKPFGAEALLRWQPPGKSMQMPATFIDIAEDSGIIVPIGERVLELACRQLASWMKNKLYRDLVLAVNISAQQFRQPNFVQRVLSALEKTGAKPERLKLEITESLRLVDVEHAITTMQALKEHGVGFSIDDFGTGYSSLAYLKRLPLDQLKIDQGFVRDIESDADDRAIVQAIIDLGANLDLQVIAEGVETTNQRDILSGYGCSHYQGYLFGRPAPLDEFEQLVRQNRSSSE